LAVNINVNLLLGHRNKTHYRFCPSVYVTPTDSPFVCPVLAHNSRTKTKINVKISQDRISRFASFHFRKSKVRVSVRVTVYVVQL